MFTGAKLIELLACEFVQDILRVDEAMRATTTG